MAAARLISPVSPRLVGRCAGAFYLVVIVTTIYGTAVAPGTNLGHAMGLASAVASVIVTALLFRLLEPAGRTLALLAAFLNLEGIAHQQDSLAFFGPFCLVTGYLVFSSTFLPRIIGVLMMLAGLGLLTNALSPLLWPSHPRVLSTVAWCLDGAGEISLTVWRVVFGVDPQRWWDRGGRAVEPARRGRVVGQARLGRVDGPDGPWTGRAFGSAWSVHRGVWLSARWTVLGFRAGWRLS